MIYDDEIDLQELPFNEIKEISTTERHYGEFKIKIKLNDNKWYTLVNDNLREKTRLFNENTTEKLVEKYGKKNQKIGYTFIHDPTLWEEPLE